MQRSTSSTNMSGASAIDALLVPAVPVADQVEGEPQLRTERAADGEGVADSMGRDPDRTYSGNGRSPVSSPTSTRRPSASAFTVFCRGVRSFPIRSGRSGVP